MMPAASFEFLGLIVLAAIAWLVWNSLQAREAAIVASRRACVAENCQFLDDTVAIESVRPARDHAGKVRLRRVYGFEYSDTGNSRHKGTVVMLGDDVVVLHIGARSTHIHPASS